MNSDGSERSVVARWQVKGIAWRRLAYLGARFGPTTFLKHGPSWIGAAFALALHQERASVRGNFQRLFGPKPAYLEELDIMRTFMAYAHCLAESLGCERTDARAARCSVQRQPVLDALLNDPKGFIIGTAHTGGWDIAAQCLMVQSGRKVILVMDREPDPHARHLQDALRARCGIEIAHVGADALEGLSLLRHLRQGGVVAVQLDRLPANTRGVEVRLGRSQFRMPQGPFVLASLAQVPLLPLFVARRGYYDYLVRVHDAIQLPRRMPSEELERVAQRVAGQLEAFLVEYPEQWFNFDAPLVAPDTANVR